MKKAVSILLTFALLLSLAACGSKAPAETQAPQKADSAPTTQATTPETEAPTEDPLAEDMEILSAIGEVEVENGILTVSITVPAALAGENNDQATLDANAGETYQSAKLNADGSITYKMTRAQHKAMLTGLQESIDSALQEMVDGADFNFKEIKYNKNMSVFDATMTVNELGLMDSFSVMAFYMYGGMYQLFAGDKSSSIIVNFYNPDGGLISTADSANMQ